MTCIERPDDNAYYPLVSIVITTYKRRIEYIRESLESALNQTYPNKEIIIVDDNGDGGALSAEIECLCNSHEGVSYMPNKRNMGAQYSRNLGIMFSSGEYIAFLDDDDIWVPEKTEVQMEFFQDPEVGMVYCDGYSFADDDRCNLGVFREASLFDRPISLGLELFNDYIGSTSQAIIRRECLACVGLFDADMPARQDYEMWIRLSRCYKIVGSPKKLLYYRKHSGERISTNWEKCRRSYQLILKKYETDYRLHNYARAKLMLRIFETGLRTRDLAISLEYLALAFLASPRCVLDVAFRRVRGIPFSEYYSVDKLNKVLCGK